MTEKPKSEKVEIVFERRTGPNDNNDDFPPVTLAVAEERDCPTCIKYIKPRWDCPDCGGTGIKP